MNMIMLVDANGKNNMVKDSINSLFGLPETPASWTSADTNQPFKAAAGGWYWKCSAQPPVPNTYPPVPVTTPWDAFWNWGVTRPPGYSPMSLLTNITNVSWVA